MSGFKGASRGEGILWAIRWYCRYGISYRDLETMLAERGVSVDHSTLSAGFSVMRLRWRSVYAGVGRAHLSSTVGALVRPT